MNTSSGPSLFDNTEPDSSHRRTFINPILWFDDCDGYRVVFCRHEVLYRVALGDPLHLALVAVTLRQSKFRPPDIRSSRGERFLALDGQADT